jgi:hypothetical protein
MQRLCATRYIPVVGHFCDPSMNRNRLIPAAVALVIAALAPGMALASQQGMAVEQSWHAMDTCAKQAQAAFPDFTAEANAKREAKLQQCLSGQELPPREPLSPRR